MCLMRRSRRRWDDYPRMSAVDTRDYLIKELQECVPGMEQIRSSEVDDNRSGAAMGWMLIAKMAMWNKEWDTALAALENLEKIYGDLMQYPLEDIPFRYKNTPESIFEIQHTYTAGGLNYSSNVACICMPYPRTGKLGSLQRCGDPRIGRCRYDLVADASQCLLFCQSDAGGNQR